MNKITHQSIPFSKGMLHIASFGPEDGQLIIFLHGFPENWLAWKKQLIYFGTKGYKAVAFDQRGYNLSSKPPYSYNYRLDLLALDVLTVIKYFNRKKIILAGHDWGANVAWWVALSYPTVISKLIILNVPHPLVFKKTVQRNIKQKFSSWYMYFFQIPVVPESIMSLDKSLLLAQMMTSSANKKSISNTVISYYRNSWTKSTVQSMINWYRGMKFGSSKKLPSIVVEPDVLLLWGLKDRFIRKENILPSLKLCKNPKAVIFPNNTHWLIHEIPDKINSKIFEFIKS